ncbi:MAG: pantetheine-phosphate adenylyltransferase [Acidobacteriota bacterium]|nr:pantetheine-phosphate adenylyltransferase [Acidobacteriota bacterium]
MERVAIYPGSFDPITNGHVDIILRGAKLFPRIIVAVLENPKKETLFATDERIEIIREIFRDQAGIQAVHFHGLLVRFAEENGARIVIRGLRAVSDFEYEFQMALMNQTLDPKIETLFMTPSSPFTFLSSSLVKEVFGLGGEIGGLVPPVVERRLREKFHRPDTSPIKE